MDIPDYILLKKDLYDFVIDFLEKDEETTDNGYKNFHKKILNFFLIFKKMKIIQK